MFHEARAIVHDERPRQFEAPLVAAVDDAVVKPVHVIGLSIPRVDRRRARLIHRLWGREG